MAQVPAWAAPVERAFGLPRVVVVLMILAALSVAAVVVLYLVQ